MERRIYLIAQSVANMIKLPYRIAQPFERCKEENVQLVQLFMSDAEQVHVSHCDVVQLPTCGTWPQLFTAGIGNHHGKDEASPNSAFRKLEEALHCIFVIVVLIL